MSPTGAAAASPSDDDAADRRGAREALLDAAYDAAVTTGWSRARMADVAGAAGVSRQTLYDQFGSREGLAQQLALREVARFLAGTEAAMAPYGDDPVAAAEAAVAYVLTAARDNPLVRAILTENGEDGLLPLITTRAEPLLAAARGRIRDYYERHWPATAGADADLVAETTTRLTVSYVVLPDADIAATARRVATLVARVLGVDDRLPASRDDRSVP